MPNAWQPCRPWQRGWPKSRLTKDWTLPLLKRRHRLTSTALCSSARLRTATKRIKPGARNASLYFMESKAALVRVLLFVGVIFLLSLLPTWSEQGTAVKPKRIVSLAPSVTETLFALGAGEQLVGICTFCDFPPEVERIERIGSYIAPNVEAIIA